MSDDREAAGTNLGRETLSGTGAKATMAIIGFVGSILFARIVGRTGFGGFYVVLAAAEVLSRPAVGLSQAVKKRFSEVSSGQRQIVGVYTIVVVAWTVVVAVLAFALSGRIQSYISIEHATSLLVVLFVPVVLFESLSVVVTGRGIVGSVKWIDTLRSVLTFPVQLALVLAGFGAAGMVVGLATATALTVPILVYLLATTPLLPTAVTVRNVAVYAKYSVPTNIVGKAYERFDVLVLSYLVGTGASGDYQVAALLTIPAFFVAEVASEGMMARISTLDSRGDAIGTDVENLVSYASVLAIPMVFGGALLSSTLVRTLYTAEYAGASVLVIGFVVVRLLQTQVFSLYQVVEGMDRPDIPMRTVILALGVNVVVGVPLVFAVGPIGIVIGTIAAEIVQYSRYAVFVKRHVADVSLVPSPLRRQVLAGVLMVPPTWLAMEVVDVPVIESELLAIVALGAVVAVGACTYFGSLWAVSSQFRYTVRSALR